MARELVARGFFQLLSVGLKGKKTMIAHHEKLSFFEGQIWILLVEDNVENGLC